MKTAQSLVNRNDTTHFTRRTFIKTTSAAIGGAAVTGFGIERTAFAAGSDTLKLALIGCGGRGTGAASQALNTGGVKLVAMADAFATQLDTSLKTLQQQHGENVDVPKDRQFVGLDAYKKAISFADVVLLTTSPGFRPTHFEEAVRQSKDVFMEKPVGTDAPGIRRLLAANEDAKKKNLKVAVGLQRHHVPAYIETVKRLHDGAIGDIHTLRCYWRGTSRGGIPREPGETELQYQIRNWYFFTWLSGDHNVEQHVHNIDVCNWIKGTHPIRAHGLGGRQVRTSKEHGQIFDHHFVEYEYADGSRMFSQCSQIPQMWSHIGEHATGTKGSVDLWEGRNQFTITGPNAWRHESKKSGNPFQLEHNDFFKAIRQNKTYNEADYAAMSTMTGIMGRMATYSGQRIEWDEAFNSNLELMPQSVSWDMTPPVLPDANGLYPVAQPGKTVAL